MKNYIANCIMTENNRGYRLDTEELSRKSRTTANRSARRSESRCWKKQSKGRAQWARHGAAETKAEKFALVLAAEEAVLREWDEILMFESLSDDDDADESAVLDEKPELDDEEIAYWEAVFQCA